MGLFDSPWHILIVLLVLVLLFGSAKLPKAAKSMGEAMRIFKKEAQKLHDEDEPAAKAQEWTPAQAAAPQPVTAPPPAAPQVAASPQEQMAALKQQMDALQQQVAASQPTVTPQPGQGTTSQP